ncbi:MAG: GlsB/YeaQ/YmgE family stress response membrane protein [Acidobacteria bacterium]|nr:MAG: GlsB/YeaQ/YmgE family stress response membrane protein [Acidobacteriota bacterium]PYV88251.1 MAG: GlsB/YeaQ/YmgE family stress response membrane protein [Acidobacteriota bacterium]
MPGKDPGGILITMALGVVGSIVATWIGRAIGWYREGQSAGFLMSIAGAILLLYIYRLVRGRTARA